MLKKFVFKMFNLNRYRKKLGYLKSKKKFISIRNFWSYVKSYFQSYSNLNKNISIDKNRERKKKILISTFSGDNYLIKIIDIIFYYFLRINGHDVFILKCSKSFNLCMLSDYTKFKNLDNFKKSQKKICNYCDKGFNKDFKNNFFKIIDFEKYIRKDNFNSEKEYIQIGKEKIDEITRSAVLRFLGKSSYDLENKYHKKIYQEYKKEIKKFLTGFEKILKENEIDLIINHHGIYFPHGAINLLAEHNQIPYYSWSQGYRKQSIIVTKNNNIHNFFCNIKNWDNFDFTEQKISKIKKYLQQRTTGKDDWVQFQSSENKIKNTIFNNNNETYFLATNVTWDAQLHFKQNFFKDMEQFIFFTINYFIDHPSKNLIIRCHPGELLSQVPSSEFIGELIHQKYNKLPENIRVFKSSSDINSYELASLSDAAIVYASKMSIELSCAAKPVICCGEAWIKDKGITFDPKNEDEYRQLLNSNISELKVIAQQNQKLALKFAYYYFFKKMIKLTSIKSNFFPRYLVDFQNINSDKNLHKIIQKILDNEEVSVE